MKAKIIKSTGEVFFILFAMVGSCFAEEAKSTSYPLAGIEINGYFDFYFQASPQAHAPIPATSAGPQVVEGTVFERNINQMTLNVAEISVKKKIGKVSFRADLALGEMVDQLSGGGLQSVTGTNAGQNPTNTAANEPTRNLTQAVLTYTASDRLTLNAGKFYTFMGYETAKAKDNWQYNRSYSYNYGVPFWHEGVNGTYVFTPDKLSSTFYLLNSWDGRISQEQNKAMTLGLNVAYNPTSEISLNLNYIGGAESSDQSRREVSEVTASYNLHPKVTLAADYIYGVQKNIAGVGDVRWTAMDLYLKWAATENYTLSPRIEYFDDSDKGFAVAGGLSGVGLKQRITSVTLANNFSLGDGIEARFELKVDGSDSAGFFKDQNGAGLNHQESYTLALLYAF